MEECTMQGYLMSLIARHRRLDRLIDNAKSYDRQEELRTLKRIRLRLKDQIAAIKRQRHLAT